MPTNIGPTGLRQITELGDGTLVGVGNFVGEAIFGSGEPGEIHLQGPEHENGFLAAWSADGDILWALRQGGASTDRISSVTSFTDPEDGGETVFAAGTFHWIAEYGTGGGDQMTYESVSAHGVPDMMILRFDREEEQ